MAQLDIRKDTDKCVVEVNTGDGWRGLSPDAARDLADSYDAAIENGELPRAGTQKFVNLLLEYADDVEELR